MRVKERGAPGRWRIAVLTACGALAGCASQAHKGESRAGYAADGAVSAEIVDRPETVRYQPVPGSTYSSPSPIRENAKPGYPPALLEKRLQQVAVVARIVVDGTGAVEHAELVENTSDESAFGDAVLSAVRGWIFTPLKRITGDRIEPLPFTQDYRFTFSQVNGRAVVESAGLRAN